MNEVKMQAGIVRNFWILDEIAADRKRWNWNTGKEELVMMCIQYESKPITSFMEDATIIPINP